MPLSLEILGVERADVVRVMEGWSLRKQRSVETFSFTVKNDVYSALAYRPGVGHDVLVYDGADLIFGGQILSTNEFRPGGEGPIFVGVQCRDWNLLAEQIVISGTIASGPLFERAYGLFQDWLEPKGVTWLSPLSGGPTIPKMVFARASVAEILSRMGKYVNHLWRINGLRQLGLWAPGDLPFPKNPMVGTDFLKGVTIDQNYYERATRLILQTGGSGETTHTETHIGNGLKSWFMLNVEPKADSEETDGGVTTVTSYAPTSVKVNGVTYALDGSTDWNWDAMNNAVWNDSAAVPSGHEVEVSFTIAFPATVRVWQPELLTTAGQLDIAFLVDKTINISHITDVGEAVNWGEAELLSRAGEPRKIKGSTMIKGFYPGLSGPIVLDEHNVNANFLVEAVTIRDVGIDDRLDQWLIYDLEFIEGDVPGRQWQDVYREALNQGSSSGGASGSSTGGGGEPGGGGDGTAPQGLTLHLGGDNITPYEADTTFRPIPEAIPTKLGGAGLGGSWTFKAFGFQVVDSGGSPGVLEIELKDQTSGAQLAVVFLTAHGGNLSGSFGSGTDTFTAPSTLNDVIAQYRVQAGPTRLVTIGHAVLTKD